MTISNEELQGKVHQQKGLRQNIVAWRRGARIEPFKQQLVGKYKQYFDDTWNTYKRKIWELWATKREVFHRKYFQQKLYQKIIQIDAKTKYRMHLERQKRQEMNFLT